MPSADKFEWPQGEPLFEVNWRAVSESLAGNGIVGSGDFEVTATANALEIQVAAGTAFYVGTEYTLGSAELHTLTSGGSDDRWDTVYFDTATSTSGVREGTAGTSPEAPDIQGDEILLAIVYVPAGATDVSDSQIHNWRGEFVNDSQGIYFDDPTGFYSADNVELALQNAIDLYLTRAGDDLQGTIDLSAGAGSGNFTPFSLGTNSGAFDALVDMTVDGNDAAGTQESYSLNIDGNPFITLYAESDGAGGIQNTEVRFPQGKDVTLEETRANEATVTGAIDVGLNPGAFGAILDAVVDGTPSAGTEESYTLSIDSSIVAKVYAEADGSGGIQNRRLEVQDLTGPGNVAVSLSQGADFTLSEALNFVVEKVTSVPGTITTGRAIFDTNEDLLLIGNGAANEYVRPLARADVNQYSTDESGTVQGGSAGVVGKTHLNDGETLNILRAALLLADGQPAPSGVDLTIITEDNTGAATSRTIVLSGDGSTVYDKETGSPLASYTNSSGGGQTIAIVVDNGKFNTGSGSSQDIFADFKSNIE